MFGSFKRIPIALVLSTILLLLYVHEQVLILKTSYSIENKEREVATLSEQYKIKRFRVDRLKSPAVLSRRVKELAFDFSAPEEQKVVTIMKPKLEREAIRENWQIPVQFSSWLHFVKEVHAKTSK